MIRSMTGFGDAEREVPTGLLRAEVRTVNHRFFSANLRLSRTLERHEPQVREWLRALLPRGHVNFTLRLRDGGSAGEGAGGGLQVDEARAREYIRAFESMRDRLGVSGHVDLALLARFGDVIVPAEEEDVVQVDPGDLRAVTEAAARAAVELREKEGARLAEDLEGRLTAIEQAVVRIRERAPARLVAERDRMRRVVAELLEHVPVDEDRIAREVAHVAERWDVSEEVVRLRSHVDLFREILDGEAAEPVGKRLAFLVQEMNREANTIGSKANDAPIEHEVVAIKDEIERLREQVENVE